MRALVHLTDEHGYPLAPAIKLDAGLVPDLRTQAAGGLAPNESPISLATVVAAAWALGLRELSLRLDTGAQLAPTGELTYPPASGNAQRRRTARKRPHRVKQRAVAKRAKELVSEAAATEPPTEPEPQV